MIQRIPVFLLLGILLLSSCRNPNEPSHAVRGRIVNRVTGQGIPGVEVILESEDPPIMDGKPKYLEIATARTDEAGLYSMSYPHQKRRIEQVVVSYKKVGEVIENRWAGWVDANTDGTVNAEAGGIVRLFLQPMRQHAPTDTLFIIVPGFPGRRFQVSGHQEGRFVSVPTSLNQGAVSWDDNRNNELDSMRQESYGARTPFNFSVSSTNEILDTVEVKILY